MTSRVFVGFLAIVTLAATPAHADKAATKCAIAKLTAAARTIAAQIRCYESAFKKDIVLDAMCVGKAINKFNVAFAKAEKKGGCTTTGDAFTVEEHAADCVGGLVADQPNADVCLGGLAFGCGILPQSCCPGLTCSFVNPFGECQGRNPCFQ